jgi:hypothetical protein
MGRGEISDRGGVSVAVGQPVRGVQVFLRIGKRLRPVAIGRFGQEGYEGAQDGHG